MTSHFSSPWNNAVALLEMRFGDTHLSYGSAFFWRHEQKMFLLTNWHNLSGRNHQNGELLSPTGAIPDRIAVQVFARYSKPDESGYYAVVPVLAGIQLADPASGSPAWRQHATLGSKVDVAALDVSSSLSGYELSAANELESDAILQEYVSQDVFVVGFPFGPIANAPAPIWKRGTIALDPTFDVDGYPKMFIDTATRAGMSGSLVLARHIVAGRWYERRSGGSSMGQARYEEHDTVVGMYSGRHYPDLERAQLGIVWKRSLIEQVVADGQPPYF